MTTIIAVETPVTDVMYSEARANGALREAFLNFLKPGTPPRRGENVHAFYEDWQSRLLQFGGLNRVPVTTRDPQDQAIEIRNHIFGEPTAIEAGGALANTFDALIKSSVNGVPLTDGVFVTAIGEGLAGQVFADALPGKVIHPPARGRQIEAHVIPIDGDRIIVTLPSLKSPASGYMSPDQLDGVKVGPETRLLMLGGYMEVTGKYNAFLDALLKKAASVSEDPRQRPTIVLTAASQTIAASETLQRALMKVAPIAPLLVFANTGEFRRLLAMDKDWRMPHEAKWWFHHDGRNLATSAPAKDLDPNTDGGVLNLNEAGWHKLGGTELENAKKDAAYRSSKEAANEAAYAEAFKRFCQSSLPFTFVVTNGKNGVRVITNTGISENFPVPPPPHGVINSAGAGDGLAGGYLAGLLAGVVSQKTRVGLGVVAAGHIIGNDKARLDPKETTIIFEGAPHSLKGLPAYLDPRDPTQKGLLEEFLHSLANAATSSRPRGSRQRPSAQNQAGRAPK